MSYRFTAPLSELPVRCPAAPPPRPAESAASSRTSGLVLRTLTDQERDARLHALTDSKRREEEERRNAEDVARRRAEREAREKTEREAAKRAGRPTAYCPPAKASLNSNELMVHFRAIPPAQRARTEVKDGLRTLLARKYPCRG